MTDWQPIETNAREHGKGVWLRLDMKVRGYWDNDLERWVLSRPVNLESVGEHRPDGWKSDKPPVTP